MFSIQGQIVIPTSISSLYIHDKPIKDPITKSHTWLVKSILSFTCGLLCPIRSNIPIEPHPCRCQPLPLVSTVVGRLQIRNLIPGFNLVVDRFNLVSHLWGLAQVQSFTITLKVLILGSIPIGSGCFLIVTRNYLCIRFVSTSCSFPSITGVD